MLTEIRAWDDNLDTGRFTWKLWIASVLDQPLKVRKIVRTDWRDGQLDVYLTANELVMPVTTVVHVRELTRGASGAPCWRLNEGLLERGYGIWKTPSW